MPWQVASIRSLECAQQVIVGKWPYEDNGIVVRILRGTKAAGRAPEQKKAGHIKMLLRLAEGRPGI
eukprot:6873131-Prymnesium_polylepis.1